MKTFVAVVEVIYADGTRRVRTSEISCLNFTEAAAMALDTEGMSWSEKRAEREILMLMKVP